VDDCKNNKMSIEDLPGCQVKMLRHSNRGKIIHLMLSSTTASSAPSLNDNFYREKKKLVV